jgi:hypothetical protein
MQLKLALEVSRQTDRFEEIEDSTNQVLEGLTRQFQDSGFTWAPGKKKHF